ncbi:MAG: hypothetical protein EU548_09505 [Promethearchaeota archaeon]|nr:MAG: hypothetical protein EU548_09505 [Candidatus Lokiarchaeota archaeon]
MTRKNNFIICAFILSLILLAYTPSVKGAPDYIFTEPQQISKGAPIFYLFSLNESESVQIHVRSQNSANYSLFLFGSRPTQTYVNPDGSLNPLIFSHSVFSNITVSPFLNYTALPSSGIKLYYLEVILLNESSDLFYIDSTIELSRYYIPQIPGFPLPLTVGIIVGSTALISFLLLKKKGLILH